ncbi:unnamed protein product [Brachionus calyciflorus]|uniref:Zinc finger protein 830 n=1 Tax=Brachionus calyciflorus TaxID=104777 RepID=A0A813M6D8_9BILA|nr:unnamed protein product [Brachionus calyciflorus]
MSLNKAEKNKIEKINSPLAKYNSLDQLVCILCNQVIKNELLWSAHLNSKIHLENKNKLKSKLNTEQQTNKDTSVSVNQKRPLTSSETEDKTELKEALIDAKKNYKKQKIENGSIEENKKDFDLESNNNNIVKQTDDKKQNNIIGHLPEGFFDDRELDAQVRGVKKEQNLNDQYEEFKRLIQIEELKADVNYLNEDKIRDVDRDLEEVEVLITRWKNIENLHIKRDEILKAKKIIKDLRKTESQSNSDSDGSDVDLDNVLNISLRTKKRC